MMRQTETVEKCAERSQAASAHDAPLSVLVVEDDPDTRDNLCDILELDGYQVQTAGSAAEGLATHGIEHSLALIIDRKLPDGNAEEFLPRFRQAAADAAIIIVTGFADLEGAIAAIRHGAEDYILKPVNADTLRTRLDLLARNHRAQQAARRSEARLRAVVDTAADGIITIDERGTIQSFNRAAEQIFGYSAGEVVSRNVKLLMPPPFHDEHDEYLRTYLETGQQRIIGHGREVVGRRKDGTTFSLELSVSEVEGIEPRTFTGIVRDVTELRQAQAKAVQAERLAAIGQMVTGLAHESRNALQRSQACLEMLALEIEDRPAALDLVARLQRAQDHLHHLYEEVRDYARPILLKRSPCDVSAIWRETWTYLESVWTQKAVRLVEHCEADCMCMLDKHAIEQVFRNILENAVEACPREGEIVIRCAVATHRARRALCVSIRDNGQGIAGDARGRVFEPFFTTKTRGTGLGMAIAARIVEAHGGEIALGDTGPGAEFLLTLPRHIP